MVKDLYFADVWKIGVRVCQFDDSIIKYQLYKIPFGETSPLICHFEGHPFDREKGDPYTFLAGLSNRKYVDDPKKVGKEFVLSYVKDVYQKREFSIYGHLLSTDILFSFLDKYAHCFNLTSDQASYFVQEIDHGLNEYFPAMCAGFAKDILHDLKNNDVLELDFEQVSNEIRDGLIQPVQSNQIKPNLRLYSYDISLRPIREAIKYLLANNINEICRPFVRRNFTQIPKRSWIWSGYSEEDEKKNISLILNNCLNEYSAFVQGNHLKFPHSVFLDNTSTVVFVYEKRRDAEGDMYPVLHKYIIHNSTHLLPKMIVAFGYGTTPRIEEVDFPIIRIDGKEFKAQRYNGDASGFLFYQKPVLNMIYKMLCDDLKNHYEMNITFSAT